MSKKIDVDNLVMIGASFSFLTPFICILFFVAYAENVSNESRFNQPTVIEKNSIGCEKIRLKDSVFWRCPKELGVNSIEERNCNTYGKQASCSTITIPSTNK